MFLLLKFGSLSDSSKNERVDGYDDDTRDKEISEADWDRERWLKRVFTVDVPCKNPSLIT